MADVSISGTTSVRQGMTTNPLVATKKDTVYVFYVDDDVAINSFYYKKSTDGGATWGSAVTIHGAATTGAGVWYDKWTPGISTDIIHIAVNEDATDDVVYYSLDPASDTLSGPVTIFAGASNALGVGTHVSITRARGGNLYCSFSIDNGTEVGLARSVNNGGAWGSRTSLMEVATGDWGLLYPGNESDSQDIWCVYYDSSATAVTLKMHDDSANTNSESATIATVTALGTSGTACYPMSAAIRHSDGHMILALVTEFDTATADHRVFDINGTGSITEKTAITTNIDDHYYPAVHIDNRNDTIYVAYVGKRDGTSTITTSAQSLYTKSTDGGTTWTAGDTALSSATSSNRNLKVPPGGERFISCHTISSSDLTVSPDASIGEPRLVAESGTFTLTGQNAGLIHGYTLVADGGVFNLTGQSANLLAGRRITADTGSFALTGQSASLLIARKITGDSGSFTLTGQAATLLLTRRLDAQAGSFNLTGQDATLRTTRRLDASSGTYALAGQAATLRIARTIVASSGSFTLTGQAATLRATRRLTADGGSVTLTGQSAALVVERVLEAESGTVNILGQDIDFVFKDQGWLKAGMPSGVWGEQGMPSGGWVDVTLPEAPTREDEV